MCGKLGPKYQTIVAHHKMTIEIKSKTSSFHLNHSLLLLAFDSNVANSVAFQQSPTNYRTHTETNREALKND